MADRAIPHWKNWFKEPAVVPQRAMGLLSVEKHSSALDRYVCFFRRIEHLTVQPLISEFSVERFSAAVILRTVRGSYILEGVSEQVECFRRSVRQKSSFCKSPIRHHKFWQCTADANYNATSQTARCKQLSEAISNFVAMYADPQLQWILIER